MNKVKDYLIIGLSILVVLFFIKSCNDKETIIKEIEVKVEVPVPVVEKQFDTIFINVPHIVKPDTIKVVEYRDSSIKEKEILYKEATAIRKYSKVYEDDYLTATVSSETSGFLNNQSFKYKTKPRTVSLDTTIAVKIEVPFKNKFFVGGELAVPVLSGSLNEDLVRQNGRVGIGVGLDTKKLIFKTSISTDGYGSIGIYYKF
tara:strand:+ start:1807 stop:2412 length:606 start_codon:yes stop_codon:yes gene_type:complete